MITQDADLQASMTPEKALAALVEGNRRFCENRRIDRDLRQQVEATRGGQWPFAVVLNCIDSRTSAELILDAGIGDIFSVRIAGNFLNSDILGSVEFGCAVAGAKLVLVMGHTHCGAIKGACDDVQLGHLTDMLAKLKPAVGAISEPEDPAQRTSKNPTFVNAVARKNVEFTVAALRSRSQVLQDLEGAGSLKLVGAMYDVESGKLELLPA